MNERKLFIPKSNGGFRTIEIPPEWLKKKQRKILKFIGPILDEEFTSFNHGFIKGRGTTTALKDFRKYIDDRFHWVASIDIKNCFSNINPNEALQLIDTRLYTVPGLDDYKGLPQGHPISSFLSNIFLNQFDQEVKDWAVPYRNTQCIVIRYADNIWLMTRKKVELQAYFILAIQKLSELGFEVRCQIRHVNQGINVLGFTITRRSIRPSPKNIQKFNQHCIQYVLNILSLTKKLNDTSLREDGESVKEIKSKTQMEWKKFNDFVLGWENYFKYSCRPWLKNLLYRLQLSSRLSNPLITNASNTLEPSLKAGVVTF